MGLLKGTAHIHDGRANDKRKKLSIARTYEIYVNKKALFEEWEPFLEPDDPYLKKLQQQVRLYRHRLKYKGEVV